MITVKLYGLYRLESKKPAYQYDKADTINAALSLLAAETGVDEAVWKNAVMYVNDTPIDELKMFRTPLKDGDTLFILSPASGG